MLIHVLGAYHAEINDSGCSATTTRQPRDEWINASNVAILEQICLEPENLTLGRCIAKAHVAAN